MRGLLMACVLLACAAMTAPASAAWYPGKLIVESRQARMQGGGWYAGKIVRERKPVRTLLRQARPLRRAKNLLGCIFCR